MLLCYFGVMSMTRLTLLLIIAVTGITMGCSSSRQVPSFNIIAWNEDTVNNYQLAFTKNGSFYYAIETKKNLEGLDLTLNR